MSDFFRNMADVVRSEYNDSGWVTYREYSDGYWYKRDYNDSGWVTYFENSDGYWYKREYDDNGDEIYYENSNGSLIVYF